MSNFHSKWKKFLQEAQQDAKVLRNINVKAIQKEMPQFPDEEARDYFARVQGLESNPEYLNPIFPTGLVNWVESLPDNHFPRDGRKRFAKWLANAVYTNETEQRNNLSSVDDPNELRIYNNDVRYIVDYLNGEAPSEIPSNFYDSEFSEVLNLAVEWHDRIGKGDVHTGDYQYKDVVYKFDNGFTIVDVNTEHDLGVEGDKMGHCVGSYCDDVASGKTTIYSLRDKDNNPHATIESYGGAIDQIKGNGNSKPKDRYAKMILQWLRTTDLNYSQSPDYLNLLTNAELQQLMIAAANGDESAMKALPPQKIPEIARSTESPELIDFFVGQIGAMPSYGGSDTELVITAGDELVRAIASNKALNEDQVYAVAKFNLNLRRPALGRQLGVMIGTDPGRSGRITQREYTTSVATRIWTELGDELKSGQLSMATNDDEKLYYMEAIMAAPKLNSDIKREIVEYLLNESFIQVASEVPANSKTQVADVYGKILQLYIGSANPDRELVKRLYSIQKDKRFYTAIQRRNRLNSSIVDSTAMTDELVDEIIRDIKEESPIAIGQNDWIKIVSAPNVSDSKKIQMLNVGKGDTQYYSRNLSGIGLPSRGNADQLDPMLKWSFSDRSMSRQFVEAAREGKFSSKVVKYMIDSAMFDPHYTNLWADQQSKLTGKRPSLDEIPYESKEGIEIIKAARMMALTNYAGGAYEPTPEKPPWVKESKEKLGAEISNYFRKNVMTKDKFYDNIKEQLNIREEKGRSRQRGIYKFYCMIAYGLTAEGDRTRGLDDILADLRALPNVTIVTVAVRNQKVAEGRYIAGLAIKFIPSTPGDMNTPENVKARIVRDIKRLTNVHSLFKLSTGLIRLE